MSMEFPNPSWSGTTSISVADNSGGAANILDLNNPWTVTVTLDVKDPFATLAGQFEVHVFAESFGPGPEPTLGSKLVTIIPGDHVYNVDLVMPANTPVFGGPPAISSFYKLAAVVEHRNTSGNETVIAGVVEGPAIHLRNP